MGIVTVKKCDSCGRVDDGTRKDKEKIQFFNVGYKIWPDSSDYGSTYVRQINPPPQQIGLWCRSCVVSKIGEPAAVEGDPPSPKPKMTVAEKLEVLIREIAYEELESAE